MVRIRDARTRFGLPSWVRGAYSCRLWLCVESGFRAFSGVSGVSGVTRGDTSIRANNEPTVRLLKSRTKSERAFSYSFLVDYCVVGEGFNDRSPSIPLRPVPALKFPLSQPKYPRLPSSTLEHPRAPSMSFIPYASVNPEDERLPPLYFRPIPHRNLEAANIAHLPAAYVKDELRALRHRFVLFSLFSHLPHPY